MAYQGTQTWLTDSVFVQDTLSPKLPAHGPLRYAVAYVNDPYGRAVAQGALDAVKERGLILAGSIPYDGNAKDFTPVAAQIAAVHPDVLFSAAYVDDGVAVRKALVATHTPLLAGIGTSSSYCMPAFGRALGRDAVGLYASDKPDADVITTGPLSSVAVKALRWARAEYIKRFHEHIHYRRYQPPTVERLFEVGIEINPLRLAREGRRLLLLAPLQVAVTWILSAAACVALGMSIAGAAMIGLSIAMSSSVVVVNITRSRRRTTDRITDDELLGWSVIQDLVGVSAALVLVVVLGIGGRSGLAAIGGVVAFVALAAGAAFVLPWLLQRLQAEHDLFLLVSVAGGLLLAGVGSRFFGIPLALAAFVAGLAITESPIAAEARQRLLPFRDLFAVMFFVALGTVIDPSTLPQALPWLVAFLAMVVVGKVLVVWIMARLGRLGARTLQLAVGLGQVGRQRVRQVRGRSRVWVPRGHGEGVPRSVDTMRPLAPWPSG